MPRAAIPSFSFELDGFFRTIFYTTLTIYTTIRIGDLREVVL